MFIPLFIAEMPTTHAQVVQVIQPSSLNYPLSSSPRRSAFVTPCTVAGLGEQTHPLHPTGHIGWEATYSNRLVCFHMKSH